MDTGLCGFPVCLLWGDVADSGVDPPTIVIAFDVREQVAPCGMPIGVVAVMDEFGFQGAEEALHRRTEGVADAGFGGRRRPRILPSLAIAPVAQHRGRDAQLPRNLDQ